MSSTPNSSKSPQNAVEGFLSASQRVFTREQLKTTLQALQADGKSIVFTNGCFDILHKGHVTYLEEAKALGDILVVGLNSDASVRRLKGPERPLNSEHDRGTVLGALRSVDFVVIFDEQTASPLIDFLRPNVYVKGGDYKLEDIPEVAVAQSYGATAKVLSLVDGYSTTNLVGKIRK